MRWAWIEHATFRSSVWRSPNWAIPAMMLKRFCKILPSVFVYSARPSPCPKSQQKDYWNSLDLVLQHSSIYKKSLCFLWWLEAMNAFAYFESFKPTEKLYMKVTPDQYVDQMISTLQRIVEGTSSTPTCWFPYSKFIHCILHLLGTRR